MSEVTITNIKSAFKLVSEKLEEAVNKLDDRDKVSIDLATQVDNYKPKLSRGGFGLLMNGNNFTKDERIKGSSLIMKDDLFIGVISTIRFFNTSNSLNDNLDRMIPAEYTELAVNTLSGIEVFNKRPEGERKIYPVRTELINEENGLWTYLTTFCIPRDFVEQSLLEE